MQKNSPFLRRFSKRKLQPPFSYAAAPTSTTAIATGKGFSVCAQTLIQQERVRRHPPPPPPLPPPPPPHHGACEQTMNPPAGSVVDAVGLLNGACTVEKLAFLLKRCSQTRALSQGKLVHAHLLRCNYSWNTFLQNWLIKMYGDCGSMADAQQSFDDIPNPNIYSWNILITAYSRNKLYKGALDRFDQMQMSAFKPDNVTFVCALDACANGGSLEKGRQIHELVRKGGYVGHASVGISLISMYGKCKSVEDARDVFNRLPHRDVVTWSAMIAACTQNGHAKEALDLFHQMKLSGIEPDEIAFLCVLDACATLALLGKGQEIHAAIIESRLAGNVAVGTAIINMYGKCASVNNARSVFSQMPYRNLITWNSMITACAQNGHCHEALHLFYRMQSEGLKPDQITYVCAIDACASLAAIEQGREIHAAILKGGYDRDVIVGNALISMYGKCGSVEEAMNVFRSMPHVDVISWNAMISTCAQNGHDKEALVLFEQMKSTNCKPDHVTFLSILSACSHSGQVDDARLYFDSLHQDYGLTHRVEHYVCMVDILCRAGRLDNAEDMINSMPFQREFKVWMCLLRACKDHGDVERGIRAASQVFKLDPENAAPYLLLSDIYAAAGRWEEARNMKF